MSYRKESLNSNANRHLISNGYDDFLMSAITLPAGNGHTPYVVYSDFINYFIFQSGFGRVKIWHTNLNFNFDTSDIFI
jgi:hypothetical protein